MEVMTPSDESAGFPPCLRTRQIRQNIARQDDQMSVRQRAGQIVRGVQSYLFECWFIAKKILSPA